MTVRPWGQDPPHEKAPAHSEIHVTVLVAWHRARSVSEMPVHAQAQPQYLRRDPTGAREEETVRRWWVGMPTPHLRCRTEDGAETSTGGDSRRAGTSPFSWTDHVSGHKASP